MKILTFLIVSSLSGGVLATEVPGKQPTTENSIHKKVRNNAPADAVIDISTPRKARSNNIEINTLSHRALPGSGS